MEQSRDKYSSSLLQESITLLPVYDYCIFAEKDARRSVLLEFKVLTAPTVIQR
jgi:hypothetical protein